MVAFRTIPEDSTGVAHILEHTALCGSKKYPVRDPFFMMIRRSLNTFMNAFTSSDWTAYPFATLFDVPKGIFEIGLGMCGPVMMEYASEEQKARFLPPMAEGKEIWCQLFSEPSAGSDVAGLRSKAVHKRNVWRAKCF